MSSRSLIPLTLILCLLISACGNIPGSALTITFPADDSVVYVAQDETDQYFYWHWSPGYITMSVDVLPQTNDPACPYAPLVFQPHDNGGSFRGIPITPIQKKCSTEAPSREVSYSWIPNSLGLHTLTVDLVITQDNGTQRTITSNSITVCVLNDPYRPVKDIAIGEVSADCNPNSPKVIP
ncbi:MAG: hypothetical protein HZB50_02935 [Chloroflexi bacterium]|nr:hypothetical protein [Chloroflexota bacterium]